MRERVRTRFISGRDGTRLRTAEWPRNPGVQDSGVCVLLGGQTEFLEKYEEVIGELAARGFAGAWLDWRGQGGSERPLSDPLKAHVADFAQYDDDLAVFLTEVVQPISATPPLALAHSMGAHILLRTLRARPRSFAGAVMTAPMLRADTRGFPSWLARIVCRTHNLTGGSERWVWGFGGRDPLELRFEDNVVTSDRRRFQRTKAVLGSDPAIRLGGPTWGWLEAALRSMRGVMAPGFAEAIVTPCLLFGAGRDRVVKTAAIREFTRRLPCGTYVEIPEARHEVLMEADAIRDIFWEAFDRFAERVLRGREVLFCHENRPR